MAILMLGIVMLATFWAVAWNHNLPLSDHSFPFLWLGYILTLNGANLTFLGHSLLTRLKWRFIVLFLLSIPFWWIFEVINILVGNWHYILPHQISSVEYSIRASLSFSTVLPAVLSTAYLANSFLQNTKLNTSKKIQAHESILITAFILGVFLLFLVYRYPHIFFPLVWLNLILITEPLNLFLNFPSWLAEIVKGRWALFVSVIASTLICGFFWEFWNYYSLPKWTYSFPYFFYFKIFEMPILGYLGYLPFGLEVYSFTQLVWGFIFDKSPLL